MKWLKWTLLGILALVLVLIIAVVIFAATFDANAYKDTVTQKVQEVTGRELDLPGDIDVSIFPWLGLSLGEAALSNAEGFGDAPFAKVESVEVHVGLLSLFKRELIIKRVELNGLELNLARNKAGVSNWDDLVQGAEQPEAPAEAPAEGPGEGEPPAVAMLSQLSLGGVRIHEARVHWKDAAGTELSIDPFNMTLDAFSFGQPTALDFDLRLLMKNPELVLSITSKTQVMADIQAGRYALEGLNLTLKAEGEPIPGGSQTLTLKADLNADLSANQASIKPVTLGLANIELEAGFDVTNLDTTPQINGRLASKDFSVRELMQSLGMEVPQTADAGVLNKAALSLDLSATPDMAELSKLAFKLDESNLSGTLSVSNFQAPAIRFDLSLDAMNADRYLPPKPPGQASRPAGETAPSTGDDRIELPMEVLRTLDLKGDMRIGHLVANELEFKDIKLKINAGKGLIKLSPVSVLLYEGKAGSEITLDVRKSTPQYGFDFNLDGVQVGPILDTLAGDKYVTGKSKMSASLNTRGDTVNGLKRALNGKLGFKLSDGAFTQSEIGESLVKVYTTMHALQGKQVDKEKVTRYNNMVGTATVTNGVMSNQDLKGDMPFFLIKGAGVVDLTRDHIDGYELGLAKYGDPNREHTYFPISIKGPLDNPKVKLDFDTYQKALLKGKVEKEKAEVKERIEKEVQEEVEEKLKDKFKGLFR